ncbi:MAG TPA: L,D-transpeptidase family protein [Sphingomicrobium sp.]|jgi:hypothetical protein|nr:L,D-transpeptidase family protein [Sphingomicrobium sp.]
MRRVARVAAALAAAYFLGQPGAAQQVDVSSGSIVRTVAELRPGQYVWAPEAAPAGPMLLVVNLSTQRALLFRNGLPIAASTVSTGRPGYRTPTGVFTILQKHVEHYSSKYDNAPMPYMERLTWYGIALHAGQLPGYPASHGCIRLPKGFAKLLYGVTSLGMTVVITDRATTPRVAPTPAIVMDGTSGIEATASTGFEWHPEKAPQGPVSVLVSAADRKAVVLRNGIVIGSAPVTIEGPLTGTWAYALRNVDEQGQHWLKLQLSAKAPAGQPVPREEWQRFKAPEEFKRAVAEIVQPGMTVVVTADSLHPGATDTAVLESDEEPGSK